MPLNEFGKISAAEIAFYAPVLTLGVYNTLKHGFSRGQGWLFLVLFSQVRLVGACVTLVSQLQTNPSTGLFIAAAIMQGIGLSPLLMATLGFVTTITRYGERMNYKLLMRLLHIILTVGLIMGIVGGTKATPDNDADTIADGRKFSKIASALFTVAFGGLFGVLVLLWAERQRIPSNHRKLLLGVSLAMPLIFIRIIYNLLNAFSSTSQNRWSPINGTWWIYLLMGIVTEYLVVTVYVIMGAVTSLKDEHPNSRGIPVAVAQTTSDDALLEMGTTKWRQERRV